jgi:transposase
MNPSPKPPPTTPAQTPFAAFIGLDWADQKHDVCLQTADSHSTESAVIENNPEALATWIASLRQRFGNRPVALAMEACRSGLLYALMQHDFLVLYPLPTTLLASFRKAFHTSGSKNDPDDAALALQVLRQHRDHLRAWKPDDVATRKLALLCEARRDFVNKRTALVQQLGATLKTYFPQALDYIGDLSAPLACDFLSKWQTLGALQRAKPAAVRAFYYAHHSRNAALIEQRLQHISSAQPLTTDEAVIETSCMRVAALVAQLRALHTSLRHYDQTIAAVFAAHPDRDIFESLPGAGAALAPRLLCVFGSDRDRHPHACSVQQFSGIAPVTVQSGKSCRHQVRRACPKFTRQSVHEFAGSSLLYSDWARAYYDGQRAAGKGHHAAVRALAFKWLRILWRLWRDRVQYDEAHYHQALKKRGSALAKVVSSNAVLPTAPACA